MKDYITELSLLLKRYFELSLEELKLGQLEMFVKLAVGLIALSLIGIILLMIILLLVVSGCLFLADYWESLPLGLLGGAGVLFILFLVLQMSNYRLITSPVKRMITKIISED
ncbi:MAG: hypothetical protein GVX78_04815 [Bacteroidetes bacterium]|jgi:hypothetical protein|nr:hypothetical protein [Bacteroidota bacterium]